MLPPQAGGCRTLPLPSQFSDFQLPQFYQPAHCPLLPHLLLRNRSDDSAQSVFDEAQQQYYGNMGATAMDVADDGAAAQVIERESVAAAAAVDRGKVASMLDALALQQPLFMSSKYVKIADLNR